MGLGILGYHFSAGFNWVISLLNAAQILTGMGPVGIFGRCGGAGMRRNFRRMINTDPVAR